MRRLFRTAALFLLAFVVAALPGTTSASMTPARLASPTVVDAMLPILIPVTFGELVSGDAGELEPLDAPTAREVLGPQPGPEPWWPTGSMFDGAMVVSIYGHPPYCVMGELGCHDDPRDAVVEARRQAAEYDELAAELGWDVLPALHLIVDVAQAGPGADGRYLEQMPAEQIWEWVKLARAEEVLLFLDIQFGWSEVADDVARLREFLVEPFVHLAVDPEFVTKSRGARPGLVIGTLTADEVNWTQRYLAELVTEYGLPPKVLVVHQFIEGMLTNPHDIEVVEDVEVSIDMDGWGPPWPKIAGYERYSLAPYSAQPSFKLFKHWDEPLMTPADVMGMSVPPVYVIYQ